MSRQQLRRFLLLALIFFCAAMVGLVFFSRRAPGPQQIVEEIKMDADVALESFSYPESRDGVAQWTLEADSAHHDLQADATHLEGVRFHLFNGGQGGDILLTAQQGEAAIERRVVTVSGDVELHTAEGYQLTTARLNYQGEQGAQGMVQTDEPVSMRSAMLHLTGRGLSYDVARRRLKIPAQVRAVLYPQVPRDKRTMGE
ncbi:MAG: LPS export ABC transporter periplasmic protein LptC [Desulfuromonadaceae bacterium]|nr:LPS export ABC transporter periplasmic protein LptC [Desulfuromonadaceae bacterium]